MATELRGYLKTISEATGIKDRGLLQQIEDHMRNDVVHSTLDWLPAARFKKAAREAFQLWCAMNTEKATNEHLILAFQTKRDREFFRTRSPEVVGEWCVNVRAQLRARMTEAA